jgi:phage tail-like protein
MADPRKDPLPIFCFKVVITIKGAGDKEAFFKSVGGIKSESEVVEYKSAGVNDATYKLIGGTKWANLVLKRGFTDGQNGDALMNWRKAWTGDGGERTRATVTITQLKNDLKTVGKTWQVEDCFPVKWEISELDASKNEIVIETLEIAHHGIRELKA